MRVSIAKLRPSLSIGVLAMAASAAFAFEAGDDRQREAPSVAFPVFLGEQGFTDLSIALLGRGATAEPAAMTDGEAVASVSASPDMKPSDVRQRAEELTQRFHGPSEEPREANAEHAAVERPGDGGAAFESAARRAVDELARREESPAVEPETAAPAPEPPKTPVKASVAAKKADARDPSRATAAPKPVPARRARPAVADAYVAPPLPPETRDFDPPEPAGAKSPSQGFFASWKPKAMPTELAPFAWE